LLLAAAELRLLAALVDVLGERLHAGLLAALDLLRGFTNTSRRLLPSITGRALARPRIIGGGGFGRVRLGNPCRLVSHQRPFHSGSRFSKKALTPSWMSSVVKVSESCERRYSSASSRSMSCWRYIASWPSLISTGLFAASLAAHS